jgi:hypothetical protein
MTDTALARLIAGKPISSNRAARLAALISGDAAPEQSPRPSSDWTLPWIMFTRLPAGVVGCCGWAPRAMRPVGPRA